MHTDDFEHLTYLEGKEILRWRAWDAKIALDQAVEAGGRTPQTTLRAKPRIWKSGRICGKPGERCVELLMSLLFAPKLPSN